MTLSHQACDTAMAQTVPQPNHFPVARHISREMCETSHIIVNIILLSSHQVFIFILLRVVAATGMTGQTLPFLFYSYDDDDVDVDDDDNNIVNNLMRQ